MPRPKKVKEELVSVEQTGSSLVSLSEYAELCARLDRVEELQADSAKALIKVVQAVEAATEAVNKPEPAIVTRGPGRGLNLRTS